jgi:predicted nuclease with TOPRIM domain
VKRIIIIVAAFLICVGTARAGELKIMVPVDDYKQMKTKLEMLEKENSQLKQEVTSKNASGGAGQEDAEALQSRLKGLEKENSSLKQQLQAQQGQAGNELKDRVSALEQENSQLQKQLAEKQQQGGENMAGAEKANEARLAEVENQNSQLQQELKILKEEGVSASLLGDKSTARELYATTRHASSFHSFSF